MPANLPPDYKRAEEAYRQASSPAAKIEALEEMLRLIPKHKGTDHLQADLRRRLSKLRDAAGQSSGKSGFDLFHIPKHGAGQIPVVGMPNCGKSALVGALTDARVNVAPFPFATHAPIPGMLPYLDVQVQLVDMPPFTAEGMVPGMAGALRNADALLVCLDASAPDLLEQSEACFGVLADRGMVPEGVPVPEHGEAKRVLTVATKVDLPGALDNAATLVELCPERTGLMAVSTASGEGVASLRECCFRILDVVRVYSKLPGREAEMKDPFVLPRGSTVTDFARAVHRGLAEEFTYARIWGSGLFDGQTVQRDHVLADGDILELHE